MSNNEPNNGVKGQVVAALIGVTVTVLTAGTAPWWWPKAAVSPPSSDPSPSSNSSPSQSPSPSQSLSPSFSENPAPQRTLINLAYAGDFYACNLPLSISIGDRHFYPHGNFFQANEVQAGQQKYTINGQINCPTVGNCQVSGEGYINVIPSNTYHLSWQNTNWGQCAAVLQ